MKTLKSENLFVIFQYGDTDIYEIYTNKADAEKDAEQRNKDFNDNLIARHKNMPEDKLKEYMKIFGVKYAAISLLDAIDQIKDYVTVCRTSY